MIKDNDTAILVILRHPANRNDRFSHPSLSMSTKAGVLSISCVADLALTKGHKVIVHLLRPTRYR
jgi:hypothetical protein